MSESQFSPAMWTLKVVGRLVASAFNTRFISWPYFNSEVESYCTLC